MTKGRIHIGTSGWNYKTWKRLFYPEEVKQKDWLSQYAKSFDTVELNTSFYHIPKQSSVVNWAEQSPDNFLFSCKASRYLTHMKKLKDPQEGLERLWEVFAPFGQKLGPVLFQLPPGWGVNTERLTDFIGYLPARYRYTFEFRNQSWLCQEVYDLLGGNNINLCFYDFKQFRPPEVVTADFIYIRLHGPMETPYWGSYSDADLNSHARKIKQWSAEGKDVYCYFDNDQEANAPKDALRLISKIT